MIGDGQHGRAVRASLLGLVTLTFAGCGGPPNVHRGAPAPAAERSLEVRCGAGEPDEDVDGLPDACELAFAQGFAPFFSVRAAGCNWDESVSPPRLGGEYLFLVEPLAADRVRIGYLPAYYRDCGWQGPKCWLPVIDCSPHAGDSEIMFIDLRQGQQPGRWAVEAIFLSAHCFGRGEDCRWYRDADLDAFAWAPERPHAPVIWIAEGRQAAYPSRTACDAGHWSIDSCDRHDALYRYPVAGLTKNVGSRERPRGGPGGCLTPAEAGSRSALPLPGAEECFWQPDAPFRGWLGQDGAGGATPYDRYLTEIGGL